MALEFTDANFQETVLDKKGLTVIDFWATWCGPCRMIAPIIEELHTEYDGKASIGKVDITKNAKISTDFGIISIPTILILKDGQVVEKHVGTITKAALEDKINAHLPSASEEEE